jgi:hypothetical protein
MEHARATLTLAAIVEPELPPILDRRPAHRSDSGAVPRQCPGTLFGYCAAACDRSWTGRFEHYSGGAGNASRVMCGVPPPPVRKRLPCLRAIVLKRTDLT